jgi:hypothetical protein
MTPAKTLETIVNSRFFPITDPSQAVIIENFDNLKSMDLSLGNETEVEGFVTFVPSQIDDRDKDLHFELFPHINDGSDQASRKNNRYPVICEIQNALEDHHQRLINALNSKRVKVRGQFRLFLEHIESGLGKFPHIFEIHPVTSVSIDNEGDLDNITIDAPAHQEWRENKSIYEMLKPIEIPGITFVNHKQNTRFENIREDLINVTYHEATMTLKFENITSPHGFPGVGFNYVFSKGKFIANPDHAPEDDNPYIFELEIGKGVNVKCVVFPEAPAFKVASEFHENPPEKVLALALRSMNIEQLYQDRIEIVMSPVFRLEILPHEK